MNEKTVSIIVPVYNGEKYIRDCIQSIQNQTYSNLEIIIVNDGSTDQSGVICEEYAIRDERIKVFHVTNGGVSPARNYALSKTTGYYLQFVDGDDYLELDATERLVHAMEKDNVELVVFNYIKILKELKVYFNQIEKTGCYTNTEYLINTLKDPGHHYYGVIWNKFYRNDIIKAHGIQFVENASLGEDFIFNLNYLCHIQNVLVIRKRLYYYNCINQNTLSRYEKNIEMCKRELKNRYIIFDQYIKTFENLGLYSKYQEKVQQYWLIYLAMNMYYIKYQFTDWKIDKLQEWSDAINNSEEIQKCKKTVSKFQLYVMIQHIRVNRTLAVIIKKVLRKVKRIDME